MLLIFFCNFSFFASVFPLLRVYYANAAFASRGRLVADIRTIFPSSFAVNGIQGAPIKVPIVFCTRVICHSFVGKRDAAEVSSCRFWSTGTCPRSSSVHRIQGAPIALPIFLSTRVISHSFVLEREAAEVSCRRILSTGFPFTLISNKSCATCFAAMRVLFEVRNTKAVIVTAVIGAGRRWAVMME